MPDFWYRKWHFHWYLTFTFNKMPTLWEILLTNDDTNMFPSTRLRLDWVVCAVLPQSWELSGITHSKDLLVFSVLNVLVCIVQVSVYMSCMSAWLQKGEIKLCGMDKLPQVIRSGLGFFENKELSCNSVEQLHKDVRRDWQITVYAIVYSFY